MANKIKEDAPAMNTGVGIAGFPPDSPIVRSQPPVLKRKKLITFKDFRNKTKTK